MLKKLETSAHTFTEFGGFQSRSFWPQIILYRNLGGAPSTAASFATVLVMVCNTPLAKMQKKASLEDYGSQGCKNQSEFRNFEEYEKLWRNMRILKGEKVAVRGFVGSEKSSILSTTLGDIPRISSEE
ncbi:hypothetical protein CFP56_036571 [Quercus suber]|uniref:Uncharacterized protein n=1 Tax=Quercus suber TaxID=58331 RepID=A0AAW0J6D5_QUESU